MGQRCGEGGRKKVRKRDRRKEGGKWGMSEGEKHANSRGAGGGMSFFSLT